MKAKEELKQLRNKEARSLAKDLDKEYRHLRELRFSRAFRKLKNTRLVKESRRRIAKVWTIIGEKVAVERRKNGS